MLLLHRSRLLSCALLETILFLLLHIYLANSKPIIVLYLCSRFICLAAGSWTYSTLMLYVLVVVDLSTSTLVSPQAV
jgi:hypothetical protein